MILPSLRGWGKSKERAMLRPDGTPGGVLGGAVDKGAQNDLRKEGGVRIGDKGLVTSVGTVAMGLV